MKLVVVLLALVCLSVGLKEWKSLCETEQNSYTFEHYKAEFNRVYEDEEHNQRKQLFEQRLAAVKLHNAGNFSWKKAINRFSDRTDAEFKAVLGLKGLRTEER